MPESDSDDKTRSHIQLQKDIAIGHYRIIERIGAGGMGEVYLAEDTELNRRVALKFLPPHLCQDSDCRARFKREAQAAAKLSHPNIVTIYDVSEFQGRPFFAMELIEGHSLREVIKQGKLSVAEAIGLTMQLCEGLQEAHEVGITHRDIKSPNIIVDRKGHARLLDFGLAAIKGTEKLTKTGSTLGTVGYMSPEQAEGKEVDQRSDIFSLGVVLYEMITGKRPFDRESDVATGKAIVTDTPEPLARYKSGVPDGLQQIVDRALEKSLETRYQTASGMHADLKRLVSSERVTIVKKKVPRLAWVAGIVVLIAVVWGGLEIKSWLGSSTVAARSIAVVDFENVGAAEDAYLASGLAEDLSIKLRQLEGVQVASSADIRRLAKENLLPREIASRLKVQFALGGSLLRQGSLVRVNVELIDKESGRVVWSDQIDKQFTEIFQFLDEVSLRIAQALQVRLTPVEKAAMATKPTENTGAYDHYLKGRHYYYNVTFRDNELAEREFSRALQLDPGYPLALAGMADVFVQRYKERFDYDEYWLDSAKVLIEKALLRKPDLAEGYESRAELLIQEDNLAGAVEAAERARDLNPGWDEPYIHLGDIYRYRGLRDTALTLYDKAVELRRSVDALCGKGEIFLTRGQIDSAEALYKAASELNSYHDRPYLLLASLYTETHDGVKVDTLLHRAIEVRPDHVTGYERLSLRMYRRGSTQEGENLLRDFIRKYPYNWDGYWALCDYLVRLRDDYPAALEITDEAVKYNPRQAWAYMAQSYLYAAKATPKVMSDVAKAEGEKVTAALQKALDLKPSYGPILVEVGSMYAMIDRPHEAVKFFNRALESGPLSSYWLDQIARGFSGMGEYEKAVAVSLKAVEQSPGVVDYYFELSSSLKCTYRWKDYLDLISEAAIRYADDPGFFVYLSQAQRTEGKFVEAIESANRAMAVRPSHSTLIHRGISEWLSGDYESALRSFQQATDEFYSGLWIVSVLRSENRLDEIESYLRSIKEPSPNRRSGIPYWADVAVHYYMSMRRYDDALDALTECRKSGEEIQTMWNTLLMAECYVQKGQFDIAWQILRSSTEETATIYERCFALLQQASLQAVVDQDLTAALVLAERAQKQARTSNNWANTLVLRLQYAAGQLDDAAGTIELIGPSGTWSGDDFYRKAQLAAVTGSEDADLYLDQSLIDLAHLTRAHLYWGPELGVPVSYYALALIRDGRQDEAREEVVRALKLEPQRADVAYIAACAYSLLGDTTLALQWLQTAVDRGYLELWWATVDPDLDPLRNYPRFKTIMTDWDKRVKAMVAKSGKS